MDKEVAYTHTHTHKMEYDPVIKRMKYNVIGEKAPE